MGQAVVPPCCLTWSQTMVEVTNIPPSKGPVLSLPHSVPPTLQQATTDPRLHWRLLDTHRQVWVSLLWEHCSFLLGPGADKLSFVPSKSLFPQSCVSSVIKSHCPPKSNSLGGSQSLCQSPRFENLLEYYSAIKRNIFESLMRLMNLESIIQGEGSQKEEDNYHTLMHICGI